MKPENMVQNKSMCLDTSKGQHGISGIAMVPSKPNDDRLEARSLMFIDVPHLTKLPQVVEPTTSQDTNSSEIRQVIHGMYYTVGVKE